MSDNPFSSLTGPTWGVGNEAKKHACGKIGSPSTSFHLEGTTGRTSRLGAEKEAIKPDLGIRDVRFYPEDGGKADKRTWGLICRKLAI